MLREKSETEDKAQGEVSDSSAGTPEKEVELSENSKWPEGSEEDSLVQMETTRRLLKSNLDR